ncbi:hypothetical protein AHAS_Ahas10G0132600 [Arachis hypogaea]
MGVPLEPWAWHASSSLQKGSSLGRATWYRRRGTPASKVTWACHLRSQASHAKLKKPIDEWACHLSIQVWHANVQEGQSKGWACHLVSKVWHASSRV